jgi:nucleoside-diphosphate-sugar epimerase
VNLVSRLLAKYDQIVIYGAKGWVGRSAVELLTGDEEEISKHQVLLIGSKTETSNQANLPFDIYSSSDASSLVGEKILFLNAAYLRREKLDGMATSDYEKMNDEIMEFGLNLIKSGRIKNFINLSSGAASQGNIENIELVSDPYAKCKIKDEVALYSICDKSQTQFINCRIYAMSGTHINEFNHLALTSFIGQALKEPYVIRVKSPTTRRTYIDSIDLVNVLFHLSLTDKNYRIDSGGDLVTLGDLAKIVGKATSGAKTEEPIDFDKSADYFGDYLEFNNLAKELGIELKNLTEQVEETYKAFL